MILKKMFSNNKKNRIIFFTLFVNGVIFFWLEWTAGYLIQEDNIYGNVGMMNGNHPLMEFDGDLGYQIRKQAMGKLTHTFPMIIEKQKITDTSGEPISSKLSFTYQEGIIRSENGDIVVNSLGYRGPYFKKNKPPDTFRIVAM
jgi:hypothetical protein